MRRTVPERPRFPRGLQEFGRQEREVKASEAGGLGREERTEFAEAARKHVAFAALLCGMVFTAVIAPSPPGSAARDKVTPPWG